MQVLKCLRSCHCRTPCPPTQAQMAMTRNKMPVFYCILLFLLLLSNFFSPPTCTCCQQLEVHTFLVSFRLWLQILLRIDSALRLFLVLHIFRDVGIVTRTCQCLSKWWMSRRTAAFACLSHFGEGLSWIT